MGLRSPRRPGQILEKQASELANFSNSFGKGGKKCGQQERMSSCDSGQEVSAVLAVPFTSCLANKPNMEDVQHCSFYEPERKKITDVRMSILRPVVLLAS